MREAAQECRADNLGNLTPRRRVRVVRAFRYNWLHEQLGMKKREREEREQKEDGAQESRRAGQVATRIRLCPL